MKDTNVYLVLQPFEFKVLQRSNGYLQIPTGAQMAVVDFLSRKGVCGEGGVVQLGLQW